MAAQFDVNGYDYKGKLNEVISKVKKPNILVCGATGAGKSSLINDIFGKYAVNVGSGRPQTRGINKVSDDALSVNLFDSEGYEAGETKWSYFKENIIGYISEMRERHANDLSQQIHEVWYCINAANHRVYDADIETVNGIIELKVPVAIVLTQIDNVDEDELNAMKKAIQLNFPSLSCFTYCVSDDKEVQEAVADYVQKDYLIKWAEDNLEEGLREGLLCALSGDTLEAKKKHVERKIIPKYVAIAAGVALTPIPGSDAALLVPAQVTMSMHILHIYGIDKISGAVSTIISSTIVSSIGKALASSLLKFIPFLGSVVNTVVASSLTWAVGLGISSLSYQYKKAEMEGKDVDIADFFTSDLISAAIEQAKSAAEKRSK